MLRLLKLWALALMLAVPVQAAEINDFDTTDANNIARWPEGMTFANVNDSARADEGILARFWKDVNGSLTTGGSSNAYTVAANQTLTAYYTGMWLRAKVNFSNTGAATLNVDSIGTKTIKKEGSSDVESGDIVNGRVYDFVYDGTNFQVLSLNALRDGIISTAKIADSAVTSAKIADGTIVWGDLAQTIFDQSPTAPATGDEIPFADASDSGNRKVATIASILALASPVPTIQKFTSGTAQTYTPTAGVRFIRVRMVGGGGGGGAAATNNGGTGGTTSFGGWTAIGGTGGNAQTATGGAGGTGGVDGTGTLIARFAGGRGDGDYSGVSQASHGGASVFGGAGAMLRGTGAGQAGATNSGSGGSGGTASGTGNGAGGGGGEYVEFFVTAPTGTTYSVGTAGTAGAAGTQAGGAGAAGIIIVEEYY